MFAEAFPEAVDDVLLFVEAPNELGQRVAARIEGPIVCGHAIDDSGTGIVNGERASEMMGFLGADLHKEKRTRERRECKCGAG